MKKKQENKEKIIKKGRVGKYIPLWGRGNDGYLWHIIIIISRVKGCSHACHLSFICRLTTTESEVLVKPVKSGKEVTISPPLQDRSTTDVQTLLTIAVPESPSVPRRGGYECCKLSAPQFMALLEAAARGQRKRNFLSRDLRLIGQELSSTWEGKLP